MIKTSTAYQAEVQRPIAGQAFIRIKFGLIDSDAAATASISESESVFFSNIEGVLADGSAKSTYATCEPGRLIVGSNQRILPCDATKYITEGFVSFTLSDENGNFQHPPTIDISFSKKHTVPALTFSFDTICNEYPAEFIVTAYSAENIILSKCYTANQAIFTTTDPIERFDKLKFTFLKTNKPFRRLRLQNLMFGLGMNFENRQVQSADIQMEVDPITRRLPVSTFNFTVLNISGFSDALAQIYDPDNPKGIWKYIEQQSPITVEFGRFITSGLTWGDIKSETWGELELSGWQEVKNGGLIEWIPGGKFFLNSQPNVNGISASFKAISLLATMTGTYNKGFLKETSLFELVQDVLQDANLPKQYDGSNPWRLWEGLKNIKTLAPAPVKKHKELLQLIAHAARCVLFQDRNGFICIEPLNNAQDNFKLDFHSIKKPPQVSKTPTLKGVQCAVFNYSVSEKETKLHSGIYNIDGKTTLEISFPAAHNLKLDVIGAKIISSSLYAATANLVIQGTGTVTVAITGNKIEESSDFVTSLVASGDENGDIEILKNPLITDFETAKLVCLWVQEYLLKRNTYDMSYRGNPEVEPLDKIYLQSQFENSFPAIVLKSELTFDSGLNGKITMKRAVID